MSVIHILKDGSVVKDITGYVVKVKDAERLYQLLDNMKHKKRRCTYEKTINYN